VTSSRSIATISVLVVVLVFVAVAWSSRSGSGDVPAMPGASASRGKTWIVAAGCGSCHAINGISGANGMVGPPLAGLLKRRVIAGRLPNSPKNLARWIAHPQQVDPGNVMPDMGLSHEQASDIALYLYEHS
jgi:cytochrome c